MKRLLALIFILFLTSEVWAANPYTIEGRAQDSDGTIDSVTFTNQAGGSETACTAVDGTFDEDDEYFECVVPLYNIGTANNVEIHVTDDDGAMTETNCQINYNDTTLPSVSIEDCPTGSTTLTTATLTGTSDDVDGTVDAIHYELNGGSWTACTDTEAWTCSIAGLENGSNNIQVRATDNEGKYGYDTCQIIKDVTASSYVIAITTPTSCPSTATATPYTMSGTALTDETDIVGYTGLSEAVLDPYHLSDTSAVEETGVTFTDDGAELADSADQLYFTATDGNNVDKDIGTIKFKFYGNATGSPQYAVIFSWGDDYTQFHLLRADSDTALEFYYGGSSAGTFTEVADLWDDTEHDVTFTWSLARNEAKLYVDNVYEGVISISGTPDVGTGDPTKDRFYLLCEDAAGAQGNGRISDVVIYHNVVPPLASVKWDNATDSTTDACTGTAAWSGDVILTDDVNPNDIQITATDGDGTGYVSSCDVTYSTGSDSTDPEIAITSPSDPYTDSATGSATISGTASDLVGLRAVNPITWACSTCTTTTGNTTVTAGAWSINVSFPGGSYGDNTILNGNFEEEMWNIDDLRDETYDPEADADTHMAYSFETGAITTDDSGKSNDLTNNNSVTAINTGGAPEESWYANFDAASEESLSILDADLSTGHPLKSTSTAGDFTISLWIQIDPHTNYPHVLSKWTSSDQGIVLKIDNSAGGITGYANSPIFYYGYNNGQSYRTWALNQALTVGQWYWFAITYDQSELQYYFHIWDDTAGAYLSGSPFLFNGSEDRYNSAAPFVVGTRSSFDTVRYFDGKIDRLIVMDKVFTETAGVNWNLDPSWSIVSDQATNSGVDDAEIWQNVTPVRYSLQNFCYEIITPGSVGTIELDGYVDSPVTLSNVAAAHCTENRPTDEFAEDVIIRTDGLWDGTIDNITNQQKGSQHTLTVTAWDTSGNSEDAIVYINAYTGVATPQNLTISNGYLSN